MRKSFEFRVDQLLLLDNLKVLSINQYVEQRPRLQNTAGGQLFSMNSKLVAEVSTW